MGVIFLAGNFNMNSQPINITRFENAMIVLNGNRLRLKNNNIEVVLSKNQTKLLVCLINEIHEKRSIINYIWNNGNCKSKENSYSQLVHKTKEFLMQNGFPTDFIITIPRHGLCLNRSFIGSAPSLHDNSVKTLNDPAFLY